MIPMKTFMDALRTGRPFTTEERKELYNVLSHIKNPNMLSMSTPDGTLYTYANPVKDYPTINVTWQPKNMDAEIDLVAVTRDLSDADSKDLKLFMWGDMSNDDITESKTMNTDNIAKIVKENL